jgi:hypothetical protein
MSSPAKAIARTGRVQNWIDNPESRLPVSCTVFVVEDSMEGPNGIEASWRFVSHALRNGAGCAVHLSKLRSEGADNGRGLVASGPVSFAKIYSTLNETLRRGGVYKNGAVVIHLDYTHPDIISFINTPRSELPWVKRCVDVDEDFLDKASPELINALLAGIRRGDIWLNKIKFDENGNRIYGNVCLEVYLQSRGTCLLQHVNLGAISDPIDLADVIPQAMKDLIHLHARTGVEESGEYLWPTEDRQVGLGLLGFANLLAQQGIKYSQFAQALDAYFGDAQWRPYNQAANTLVYYLALGINRAATVARNRLMHRAFCIAPTASCSYQNKDIRGFTTAPEIAPPISRQVDRDSGTLGVQSYEYPPDCEIASEVGWDVYKRVADGIVSIFQSTGLFHGYSFNSWSDVVTYDESFLREWVDSPQTSLYYSLQVMPDTQAKDDALGVLDEDYRDFFNLETEETSECTETFCPACAE